MRKQLIKTNLVLILLSVISFSCIKEDINNKADSSITFELDRESVNFNNGYFWGGNIFSSDSRCNYQKCLYESSYIQYENDNGTTRLYISFSDSTAGTYSFLSSHNQLKAFYLTYNDNIYQAYPYIDETGDFIVEITEFGDSGEHIKGSFSGTAVHMVEGTIQGEVEIANGSFDIIRNDD